MTQAMQVALMVATPEERLKTLVDLAASIVPKLLDSPGEEERIKQFFNTAYLPKGYYDEASGEKRLTMTSMVIDVENRDSARSVIVTYKKAADAADDAHCLGEDCEMKVNGVPVELGLKGDAAKLGHYLLLGSLTVQGLKSTTEQIQRLNDLAEAEFTVFDKTFLFKGGDWTRVSTEEWNDTDDPIELVTSVPSSYDEYALCVNEHWSAVLQVQKFLFYTFGRSPTQRQGIIRRVNPQTREAIEKGL